MCWLSTNNIMHIASEDIPISKLCILDRATNTIHSIYYCSNIYELGTLYKQDTPSVSESLLYNRALCCYQYVILKGFHSYDISMNVILKRKEYGTVLTVQINYNTLDWFQYSKDIIRVNGYIPKGTAYFVNENKEYVSEAIVLTEISAPWDGIIKSKV